MRLITTNNVNNAQSVQNCLLDAAQSLDLFRNVQECPFVTIEQHKALFPSLPDSSGPTEPWFMTVLPGMSVIVLYCLERV